MRELHVVAISEDGRSVLLATSKDAKRGGFRVALDDRLARAVRGDLPRVGEPGPRESELTPKEIQARLRAGESPEQIAAAAGVAVARVERFSGPVLSERARIVDAARAAVLVRGRRGPSALPLGEAVDAHLAETPSLKPESVAWTARREDAGTWLVEVAWVSRARRRTAQYRYDPTTRHVLAVDAPSGVLGHVDAAPAPRGRKAAPAKKAAPAARPAAKAAPKKKAPAKKAALRVVPDPPAAEPPAPPVPPKEKPVPGKRTTKGRAAVPAWADVLLGTSARDEGTRG